MEIHQPARFVPDLKNKLFAFVERETLEDYDREAEAALQRITNGEVDINKMSNLWAKAYTEVRAIHVGIVEYLTCWTFSNVILMKPYS